MRNPTLAGLLAKLDDDSVAARVVELYPDQNADGYRHVLYALRALTPVPSECRLTVDMVDDGPGERFANVSGIEGRTYYAIEYVPWVEWLGMPVTTRTLRTFKPLDIAAHALWEMTWAGFDEDKIQARARDLCDAAASARAAVA